MSKESSDISFCVLLGALETRSVSYVGATIDFRLSVYPDGYYVSR